MNEKVKSEVGRASFSGRFFRWLFGRRTQKRALLTLAGLATLVALFYLEEDWRGKRAWENCKRDLEAQGLVLDWDKFIPAPVPDDQNFFTASANIRVKFKKFQTEAEYQAATNSAGFRLDWLRIEYSTNPNSSVRQRTYAFPVLDTAKTGPLVVANISVAPSITAGRDYGTNFLVVTLNDHAAPQQVRDLIQRTVGQSIPGAAGFQFSAFQLTNLQPARIIVRAETPPSISDLETLIPPDTATNIGLLYIEPAPGDQHVFQILSSGVRITAAADFLNWSDQFEPAFDEVREALKRPYAIIPGDYTQPYLVPIPNFVMMRSVAQMLAQRAQCRLLLGAPDKALREMTLLHDVCRILEKPPTGKPMTLVEAMINVAITGLYVNTIADGFRLRAWQEPQLAALQEQVKGEDVLRFVFEAFRTMPAAECRNTETVPLPKLFSLSGEKMDWWSRVGLWLMPRGWVYQNMVNLAVFQEKPLSGFDPANNTVSPRQYDDATRDIEHFLHRRSPFKMLAAIAIPNYVKAEQTTAYNQTLANEAQIACALERYRLAHGEYPESLDALVPQFIEKLPHDIIGGQPLHYRRTDDGKFVLYSVGWNETDDGGQVALTANGRVDFAQGDWVWQN